MAAEGRYEAWYLIVHGRLWVRRSLHVSPRGEPEWASWIVAFGDEPVARKSPAPPGDDVLRGEVDGGSWRVEVTPLAPPFRLVHPLLRPLAKTKLDLLHPAVRVDGEVELDGVRSAFDGALGTVGHVYGTRHAEQWGWAHATLPNGGWVELLVAKVKGLPQVASFATAGRPRSALRLRGTSTPTRVAAGPFAAETAAADLVGVTYRDPDGAAVYCYHSETARLSGPGVDAVAAFEYGTRRPLEGVRLFL